MEKWTTSDEPDSRIILKNAASFQRRPARCSVTFYQRAYKRADRLGREKPDSHHGQITAVTELAFSSGMYKSVAGYKRFRVLWNAATGPTMWPNSRNNEHLMVWITNAKYRVWCLQSFTDFWNEYQKDYPHAQENSWEWSPCRIDLCLWLSAFSPGRVCKGFLILGIGRCGIVDNVILSSWWGYLLVVLRTIKEL